VLDLAHINTLLEKAAANHINVSQHEDGVILLNVANLISWPNTQTSQWLK